MNWLVHAVVVLTVWTFAGFLVALALGSMISRADRDAEAIDSLAQAAAEADEIARSIGLGGAAIPHDGSFNK